MRGNNAASRPGEVGFQPVDRAEPSSDAGLMNDYIKYKNAPNARVTNLDILDARELLDRWEYAADDVDFIKSIGGQKAYDEGLTERSQMFFALNDITSSAEQIDAATASLYRLSD